MLYISTELEEVMAMGDRIAVMYEGQFIATLDVRTTTLEQVGLLMAGGHVERGRGNEGEEYGERY